jgi:uncharacterized membrane protein
MILTIKPIYYYYLALTGFFGLFILLMLWNTVFSTSPLLPVTLLLLITVTPLLLPMRGLLNRHRKSCAWAAYVSLLYFIHGCVEAYASTDGRLFASIEILMSLLLFFGTLGYVRFAEKVS